MKACLCGLRGTAEGGHISLCRFGGLQLIDHRNLELCCDAPYLSDIKSKQIFDITRTQSGGKNMMHKLQRIVLVLAAVLVVAGFSDKARGEAPVKIKGFFIGMSIEDALKNFERLGFTGLSIRENQYQKTNTYYSIRSGSGSPFKVETALNTRNVASIYFSSGISDRLFHTKNIGAEIFKDLFTAAYQIPNMAPLKNNPGADAIKGWEYCNLELGYRIRITLNKDVEIIETGRKSDFSFD